jgi:ribosomal protein L37AE/L43A
MSKRPGWYPDYWKKVDKKTAKKMRTLCPRCGSDKTYYNAKFKIWRCGACEHSFMVKGVKEGHNWFQRLFGKK